MVTLTGMGLKFSSLVIDLSFGIKALAILLIGGASLVLGMGLPVTASYIVLSTLAGPAIILLLSWSNIWGFLSKSNNPSTSMFDAKLGPSPKDC